LTNGVDESGVGKLGTPGPAATLRADAGRAA
jgi:hypothetical protein